LRALTGSYNLAMAVDHLYRVVLRAPSRARFMPNEELVVDSQSSLGSVTVILRTRWEDIGMEAPVPRELWVEVTGRAPAIEAAMSEFPPPARQLGPMMAFVANIEVGMVDIHLAFDATSGIEDREFVEVFWADEKGLPTEGRIIEPELLAAFISSLAEVPDRPRIVRALGHYDIALRSWFFGGEPLAVGHLFMAAEALGKVLIRARCREQGLSESELARSVGIDLGQYGGKSALAAWARTEGVFHGDADTHQAAREASDGLEHGFMEMSEVHSRARAATERTFGHIRQTILDLLNLPEDIRERILAKEPRDVRSMRKVFKGRFLGKTDDPAAPGQEYPLLEWKSSVKRLFQKGPREFSADFTESVTVRCADDVKFQGHAFQIHGRLRPGQEPVDLGSIDLEVVKPPDEPTQ
jgi:hypothetical protein